MNCLLIMLASSVPGVDYGWQPMNDGRLEYIIQIEPELLQLLADGEEITNVIHPDVKGVRRFRIRVGREALPRRGNILVPQNTDPPLGQRNPTPGGEFTVPKIHLPMELEANSTNPPSALIPDPTGKPIGHQAAFAESGAQQTSQNGREQQSSAPGSTDKEPWMPLVFTALVLFASIGLNAYLGWIAYGVSRRFRETLRELRDSSVEAT